ncbi:hypothetical protein CgunFtcFv8_013753 [Champsocephalus gunnari]|uniref:Uncharacterized protein n=1 Tax=Champsocephalus gunnari TaxID=52237 RepID=A0AAN8E657_CHAGU|nr:hypothetical protein CgunFtcFv8_013753 [Champsocephalus gunnari]
MEPARPAKLWAASTMTAASPAAPVVGKAFYYDAGRVFCEEDFKIYCLKDCHRVLAPKCAACNQPILPSEGSDEIIQTNQFHKRGKSCFSPS